MPLDPSGLIARYDRLASQRFTFESVWQQIADHGLGRRDFTTKRTPGSERMARIYDNTFLLGANMLAAGVQSLIANTATQWFELVPEAEFLVDEEPVARWIEEVERRLLSIFNRPTTGFVTNLAEVCFDLVAFGTGGLFIGEDPDGPFYSSRPLGELVIAEDARGRVDTVFRRFRLAARLVEQMFQNVSQETQEMSRDPKRADTEVELLHGVFRRDDPVVGRIDFTGMPLVSVTLEKKHARVLRESGFWEPPFVVARWSTDSGEFYGRGPGHIALPEAKMLNSMRKTVLKAAQKATDPPSMVEHDGIIGSLQLIPNGITKVRANAFTGSGGPPIQQLPVDARGVNIGVDMIERSRQNVRSAFLWELLQLIQDPRMTATQVVEIAQNQMRVVSPILARIQSELLEPTIARTFGIELRAGRLPPPPPQLAGTQLKVHYLSPVTRAQKSSDAQAIRNTIAAAAEMSQFDRSILDLIDTDEAFRRLAVFEGAPLEILRGKAAVAEIRRGQTELAQERAALAAATQVSQIAKNVAPAAPAAA